MQRVRGAYCGLTGVENDNERSIPRDFDRDTAPELSGDGWPEKFAKATIRRGRLPVAKPKVSTTIRLSQDVIDHFKAGGRGWQTRIDEALREWIGKHAAADGRLTMSGYDKPLTPRQIAATKDENIDFSDIPELDESF